MIIYLLSSVYPSRYSPNGVTPVVHYFAKEWVKQGHVVHVFHTESVFPKLYYFIGKLFGRMLYSRFGYPVPTHAPQRYDEIVDGVQISHLVMNKIILHGRFSDKQLSSAINSISSYISIDGLPDCFVGHWDNPQLELLYRLKQKFNRPTCIVFHNNGFRAIIDRYKRDTFVLIENVDLIGFRSESSYRAFVKLLYSPKHYFIASSGVSQDFIDSGNSFRRPFDTVSRFVFVGSLIERKYPISVIEAVLYSFKDSDYTITYIGDGEEKEKIQKIYDSSNSTGKVYLLGRIPRSQIIHHLEHSDVFVMISRNEVFGLVYLEAMALGCITIASRGEGMDGIIVDGKNGFLCAAGNSEELADIILKIRQMDSVRLQQISLAAKETASRFSDASVAKTYLNELMRITNK